MKNTSLLFALISVVSTAALASVPTFQGTLKVTGDLSLRNSRGVAEKLTTGPVVFSEKRLLTLLIPNGSYELTLKTSTSQFKFKLPKVLHSKEGAFSVSAAAAKQMAHIVGETNTKVVSAVDLINERHECTYSEMVTESVTDSDGNSTLQSHWEDHWGTQRAFVRQRKLAEIRKIKIYNDSGAQAEVVSLPLTTMEETVLKELSTCR